MSNANGNGRFKPILDHFDSQYGGFADPITVNRMHDALAANQYAMPFSRSNAMTDPRRSLEDECGYPALTADINPELYWQLYARDPIAARLVEIMPKQCWQMPPLVFEKEKGTTATPFEEAWDDIAVQLRGKSWYKQEMGNPVFEYLIRGDILSGVGSFGCVLLGLDDGKRLDES